MSAEIVIGEDSYILLAAVPYISKGFFDVPILLSIAGNSSADQPTHGDAGIYWGLEEGPVLDMSLYEVNHLGHLVAIPLGTIAKLFKEFNGTPADWAVTRSAELLINSQALKYKFDYKLLAASQERGTPDDTVRNAIWDVNAPLPPALQRETRRLQLLVKAPPSRRRDSANNRRDLIRAAMRKVEETIPGFNWEAVPGRRQDLVKLFIHLDRRLAFLDGNPSTTRKSYFYPLRINFASGSASGYLEKFGLKRD